MSKLVTRRVKRGKHVKRGKRSRCGGKHSKRKGYSKYKKHYTRKYGRRNRSRTKRGGQMVEQNFDGLSYSMWDHDRLRGRGYVLVTKLNDKGEKAWNSKEDDFQIMVITQGVMNDYEGDIIGKFRIFKCRGYGCSDRKEIVTRKFDMVYENNGYDIKEVKFSTIPNESNPAINYRLKLVNDINEQSLRLFFYGYSIDPTNFTPNTAS